MIINARACSGSIPGTGGLGDVSQETWDFYSPGGEGAGAVVSTADTGWSFSGMLTSITDLIKPITTVATTVAPLVLPLIKPKPVTTTGVTVLPTSQPVPASVRPAGMTTTAQQAAAKNSTMLYVALGVGAVVILGGIMLATRRK